jgi:hypothetical protein
VRTLIPLIVAGGIATEVDVDVETLSARLQEELRRRDRAIRSGLTVGAWKRTP